jgi:hypothetical protein
MLGIIFGKLYGCTLEKIISRWVELKGDKVRGQACFKEGIFSVDHILTLCLLLNKSYLQVYVSIQVLLSSKKY